MEEREYSIEVTHLNPKQTNTNNPANLAKKEKEEIIPEFNNLYPASFINPKINPEKKQNNEILIEQVEIVYLNIQTETEYHRILKIILCFLALISFSFMHTFTFNMCVNRQFIYCFNTLDQQFEVCSIDQACKYSNQSVTIQIYDKSNLSNIDEFNLELTNVNMKYTEFFRAQSVEVFSQDTYNRLDLRSVMFNRFNGFVVLTDKEQQNIAVKYNDLCSYNNTLEIFGLFIFISSISSSVYLSIFSDILGRKKVLIFGLSVSAAFCICLYGIVTFMDTLITNAEVDYDNKASQAYASSAFPEILKQLYYNNKGREIFKNYKIIMALFLFAIHFSITAVQNTSLCLLVENCINDNLVYKNFWLYSNGIIISVFYSYVTNVTFNEFKYSYLINGVLLTIILGLVAYYLKESPRQYYAIVCQKYLYIQ